MHQHLAASETAGHTEGVLFVGRAQEKTAPFRSEKRRDDEGKAYPWIVKATGLVNNFYIHAVYADFGPFFLKFCSVVRCWTTTSCTSTACAPAPSSAPAST